MLYSTAQYVEIVKFIIYSIYVTTAPPQQYKTNPERNSEFVLFYTFNCFEYAIVLYYACRYNKDVNVKFC